MSQNQQRLLGFRHNPYIGTFHRFNYIPFNSQNMIVQNMMSESKTNPMIGLIRHSPSVISKDKNSSSKKSSKKSSRPPPAVLSKLALLPSQIQPISSVSQEHSPNFVSSLKEFRRGVYSSSSSCSSSRSSPDNTPLSPKQRKTHSSGAGTPTASLPLNILDNDFALCGICLDKYQDGDEILTLNCGHCYHSECISKWFYQDCLNSEDMRSNFTCPHCRKNNIDKQQQEQTEQSQALASSTAAPAVAPMTSETLLSLSTLRIDHESGISSIISEEGILGESLLRLGQSLMEEDATYDFVSDLTSINSVSSRNNHNNTHSNNNLQQVQQQQQLLRPKNKNNNNSNSNNVSMPGTPMGRSLYSDCGIPLLPANSPLRRQPQQRQTSE